MGFATFADYVAAPRLERTDWDASESAETTTTWGRLGALPTTATTPGTAYDENANALFNAIQDTDPVEKYLSQFVVGCTSSTSPFTVLLLDRLVGVNQVITTTGSKTINSVALPRYTSGHDVMVFLEVSVVTATAAPVISLNSYTNQDGTNGRAGATVTFPAAATNVGCWIGPMPLQAGDSGVKSVETINVATASGGSGAINVILARPISMIGVRDAFPTMKEYLVPPRIFDGACLTPIMKGSTGDSFNVGISLALEI